MIQKFGNSSRNSSPLVRRQSTEVKRETESTKGPAQLNIWVLVMILCVGATATTFGLIHINTRFETRDYMMETARLQTLSKDQHDDIQTLETQLGGMTRDSNLREAAVGPLGLVEPATEVVTGIQIDRAEEILFQQIEDRNRTRLNEAKQKYLAVKEQKETTYF